MKKLFLFIALMLSLSASAQVYPPELTGLQAGGLYSNVHLVAAEVYNPPVSIPIDQSVAWVTQLYTTMMPPVPMPLVVQYSCLESMGTGQCIAQPPTMYVNGSWPWDPTAGSYLRTKDYQGGALKEVDAFVFSGSHWEHYTGVVEYTGACCPWYNWEWFYRESQVSEVPPFHMYQLQTE